MDFKIGLVAVGSFISGSIAGAAVTYIFTKRYCDEITQQSIDQMKASHKEELNKIKEEIKNASEETNEPSEKDEIIFKDKPNIMEMSSIVTSNDSDNSVRTQYNFRTIKESFKKVKADSEEVKKEKNHMIVIDYSRYMELDDELYSDYEFFFNSSENVWYDWNHVSYEVDNLPFEPENIIWTNDQCYLLDDENHTVYSLDRKA